jgi:hypothetical protein
VFEELRALKKAGARFDLIVLDPPKFAPSAAHADRAARAYKDINLLGFRLLNPGGLLMTYSCSAASAWSCSRRSSPARRHRPRAADRRRRSKRRRGGCAHPAAPLGGARPSRCAGLPGRRVPEGPAVRCALAGDLNRFR